MRKLLAFAALLSLAAAQPALAQLAANYTINDCSIGSLSGSSQQLLAANPQRKFLEINNPSTNQIVYLNLAGGTAASAVSSLVMGPVASSVNSLTFTGGAGALPPANKITVTGSPGSPVTCYEGR
jgi:hypothetical protein